MCVTLEDIQKARNTIKDYIKKTPLIKAPNELSKQLNHRGQIYFKCENFQWTNTFKSSWRIQCNTQLKRKRKKNAA